MGSLALSEANPITKIADAPGFCRCRIAFFIGGGNTFRLLKALQDLVQPRSFDAIGLVPFQISPHFQDPDPNSRHMGETQEERVIQFLEENETPVLGMREGAWVVAETGAVMLQGSNGARIFRRGHEPVEAKTGDDITALVGAAR